MHMCVCTILYMYISHIVTNFACVWQAVVVTCWDGEILLLTDESMDDNISDPLFVDLDQLWFLARRVVFGEDGESLEVLVRPDGRRTHPRHAKQAKQA